MREMRVNTGSLMQLKSVLNYEESVSLELVERLSAAAQAAGPTEMQQYNTLIRAADRLSDFYRILAHASEFVSGETELILKKARAELEENILSMRRKPLF